MEPSQESAPTAAADVVDDETTTPTVPHGVEHYFIGYLKQGLTLTGQISRKDWEEAVDAAKRYERSLPK